MMAFTSSQGSRFRLACPVDRNASLEGRGMAMQAAVVELKRWDMVEPDHEAIEAFPTTVIDMVEQHRPSRMPFFRRVKALPLAMAADPEFSAMCTSSIR